VELDEGGYITAFTEKPPVAESVLISAGVYVFGRTALEGLPVAHAFSLEREFFPGLAAAHRLRGHVVAGYFVDIGTPEAWRQFEQDLVENKVR
jgi:mannose-1-phosphate guanylyltransferase